MRRLKSQNHNYHSVKGDLINKKREGLLTRESTNRLSFVHFKLSILENFAPLKLKRSSARELFRRSRLFRRLRRI
jgi:hypothetical protein